MRHVEMWSLVELFSLKIVQVHQLGKTPIQRTTKETKQGEKKRKKSRKFKRLKKRAEKDEQ